MNKKDALKNIRETLKNLMKFSNEVSEEKFGTLELMDGTKITTSASDLEVGAEIYVIDDLGNQSPLDDGEYTLTDGRSFVVSNNVIETINEGVEEGEDPIETPEEVDNKQMDSNLPEGHQDAVAEAKGEEPSADGGLEARIADLEKQLEDIKSILDKMGSIQNDVNEQMMSKISRVANEPGAEPIKSIKKETFNYNKTNKSKEAMADLKEFFKERSKK